MAKPPSTHAYCPNCGNEILDRRYCAECGQENVADVYSVRDMFRSVLDEALSLDSKVVRSMVPLLVKPGFLTNQYVAGRRAHFVRPLRLYLVSSLLFFLVLSLTSQDSGILTLGSAGSPEEEAARDARADSLAAAVADSLRAEGIVVAADQDETIGEILGSTDRAAPRADRPDSFLADSTHTGASTDDDGTDDDNLTVDIGDAGDIPLIGAHMVAQKERIESLTVDELQTAFGRTFRRHLPKTVFVLVPVFALILKLLYVRRRRYYIEHLVFAFHVHAFLFLIFTLMVVNPWTPLDVLLLISTVVYLFVAIRRVYRQSWPKTVLKFVILQSAYQSALAMALILTALVTALTI